MSREGNEFKTIITHISGGKGGTGGEGGVEGGGGGAGEGPIVNYDIKAVENFTTNIGGSLVIQSHRLEKNVRKRLEFPSDTYLVKQRETLIEWWSPINFFTRQQDIFSTQQLGTGEWFLGSDQFKAWILGLGTRLWCPGMPGAGKTVIASIVVHHIREILNLPANTAVAVVYLNHKETETQSPANILASIWRQLVFKKPILPEVRQLYEKHCERRTRPFLEEFHRVLCSTVAEYSKVSLIIDALDEYPEKERRVLLDCLAALGSNVNLMLTSRPHICISTSFVDGAQTMEIRATAEDIRRYVKAEISISPRLSKHVETRPDLLEEILTVSVRRSGGMFLLAKLNIISLATKHTVKAVRDALESFPIDLDNAYEEAMQRIIRQGEDDRKLAYTALAWISNAKRLLRVSELGEALSVEPETSKLDPDNFMDIDFVLSVCAGLVVIEPMNNVVRLVHYTTQQYLDRTQATHFPTAQTNITSTCITYLSFTTFVDIPFSLSRHRMKEFQDTHSFLDYAVQYCLVHAHGQPEWAIRDHLLLFLSNASRWIYVWALQRNLVALGIRLSTSRLWIAAFFDLQEIAQYLISIEEDEDNDNALQAAVANGHHDMILLLFSNGADTIDGEGKSDGSAIEIAAYFGDTTVVALLISKGADVNAQGGRYGTALHAASARGHVAVIRQLMAHAADVNAERRGITALQVASDRGNVEAVRLLLENGADVNARGGRLGTALYAASRSGNKKLVRLLLESGAVFNLLLEGGALVKVTGQYNHEEIAQILLATHFNRQRDGTLLLEAIECGNPEVVQLLLRDGADLNKYGTALHAACRSERTGFADKSQRVEVVRLLLENGADINKEVGNYGTVLHMACSKFTYQSHTLELVQLLLGNGANVNAQGGKYGTALHAACRSEQTDFPCESQRLEVIRLLLKNGADINAEVGNYGTVLHMACSKFTYQSHSLELVQILLGNGANVNAQGGKYGTALHAACRSEQTDFAYKYQHLEVIRLLLENGADVDAQDGRHGTPLQVARFMRDGEDVVKLLLANGATEPTTINRIRGFTNFIAHSLMASRVEGAWLENEDSRSEEEEEEEEEFVAAPVTVITIM
ncbi:ankyrin repeat-containing domain protein [Mycena galericulata]|nr:ankyrin repeat-containing domain protein [Mycena galericulata]